MKIQSLLDDLPHDTLMRLCGLRNLSASRDETRRARLARSYSGDYTQFVLDLRKEDLLVLLRGPLRDVETGQVYRIRNATAFSVHQLHSFLLHIFTWDAAPISLEMLSRPKKRDVSEQKETEDSSEEKDDSDKDDANGDDRYESDADDAEFEEPQGAKRAPKSRGGAFDGLTTQWSRPKKICRIFVMIGEPAPHYLRETHFLGLIGSLGRQGIEVTLANSDGRPFSPGSACPSSQDKIRLRRKVSATVGRGEKVQAPERALDSSTPVPAPGRDEWQLAMIRLRFLTAVPIADRHLQADWPHGFIEAALRGLSLSETKKQLLSTASQQFVAGNHDVNALIPDVLALHSREERIELFDQFRRLNARATDYVEQVIQLAYARVVPQGPSVVRTAASSMPSSGRVSVGGENHTNRNPPHSPIPSAPPATPSQNDSADEMNVRNLGIFEDLFKAKR